LNKIINYGFRREVKPFFQKDTYRLRVKNKFINWFINILRKYKIVEDVYFDKTSYYSVSINKDKVIDLIKDQLDYQLDQGERPTTVILGRKQMEKLEIENYQMIRFEMKDVYQQIVPIRKVCGLEIILSPYIDGIVIF
jgi:hypothetical protein